MLSCSEANTPRPIFGFRSCKSGGCRGRKEAKEISHESPVCHRMHKAGSLQARAMAVCRSAEISGSREPRGQGRGVCFPFCNRRKKKTKNKNAKPPFHSLWRAAISAQTAGRKRGGGVGGRKRHQLTIGSAVRHAANAQTAALRSAGSTFTCAAGPETRPGLLGAKLRRQKSFSMNIHKINMSISPPPPPSSQARDLDFNHWEIIISLDARCCCFSGRL